jgi:threonine synthase
MMSSYLLGLECRGCGKVLPVEPTSICDDCYSPVEPIYDYNSLRGKLTHEVILSRPRDMWRYSELLPLQRAPQARLPVGGTPLIEARNLGRALGHRAPLYIKNDAMNYPTLSFKDRVVSVALNAALEFGYDTLACSSTGNLANAVAAQAARAGIRAVVFVPENLEETKLTASRIYGATVIRVQGNYDAVNRLCTQISQERRWAFVNVNFRPFYAEGSKTVGYEIAEQLGWKLPGAVVVPMAGGSLIGRIRKSFSELGYLGLVDGDPKQVRICGAQASGCAPIARAVETGSEGIIPERPDTIAKSLAIGNPADGPFAARAIRESGGSAAHATDEELIEGIRLLASTEGIFAETAGGVTVAAFQKLLAQGAIDPDQPAVLVITGNGLKTAEAVSSIGGEVFVIPPKLRDFDRVFAGTEAQELVA